MHRPQRLWRDSKNQWRLRCFLRLLKTKHVHTLTNPMVALSSLGIYFQPPLGR